MKDMQANHELHITRIIYACKIQKQSKVVTSIQKKYQQVSEDWHQFLKFEIKKEDEKKMVKQDNKQKQNMYEMENKETNKKQWKRLKKINLEVELKKIIRLELEFKNQQQQKNIKVIV